jgi:hypothetical protein
VRAILDELAARNVERSWSLRNMKRPIMRIVFVISSITFGVLFISWLASIALSFIDDRPRWVEPYLAWRTAPTRVYSVQVTWGGLSLERRDLPWAMKTWPPTVSFYDPEPGGVVQTVETLRVRFSLSRFEDHSFLGFEKGHWDAHIGYAGDRGQTHGAYIAMPIWFLLPFFGFLPGRVIVKRLRERRHARVGMCRVCGYDLRASPQRCPECGTPRRANLLRRMWAWTRRAITPPSQLRSAARRLPFAVP